MDRGLHEEGKAIQSLGPWSAESFWAYIATALCYVCYAFMVSIGLVVGTSAKVSVSGSPRQCIAVSKSVDQSALSWCLMVY